MKTTARLLIFIGLLSLFTACGEEPGVVALPSTDEPLNDGVVDGTPLYLKLGLSWEGTDGKTIERIGNCSIPNLAPIGHLEECTISIPELKLYYSDVHFNVGTLADNSCAHINFSPYYYLRSTDAAYLPPGETSTVDCSPTQKPAKCYGGAATNIAPDFPKNVGVYFLPSLNPSAIFTLKSENATRLYGGARVNYLASNSLTKASQSVAEPPGLKERAGGAFNWVNYTFTCRDIWAKPLYTIELTITEENKELDEFDDWD
ncbi:hypothetical protein QJS83_12755 [Bdellovibrio sp. 22V]|uniref:hypothetical protein n=1 Tax=Bdellovibrio sp. 22V TaxID=3044166 RepID=UPI0025434856|nr:hypothetical protein [Bdellovibrio sp. 22V]WII71333.1 hypothetical protein QJS83_12755 [Bdellovibrio sp. 22V]